MAHGMDVETKVTRLFDLVVDAGALVFAAHEKPELVKAGCSGPTAGLGVARSICSRRPLSLRVEAHGRGDGHPRRIREIVRSAS